MIRKLFKIFASGLMVFSGVTPVLAEPSASPEAEVQTVEVTPEETPEADISAETVVEETETTVPEETQDSETAQKQEQTSQQEPDEKASIVVWVGKGGSVTVSYGGLNETLSPENNSDYLVKEYEGVSGEEMNVQGASKSSGSVNFSIRNAEDLSGETLREQDGASHEVVFGIHDIVSVGFVSKELTDVQNIQPAMMRARISPRISETDDNYADKVDELIDGATGGVISGTRVTTDNLDIYHTGLFNLTSIAGGPVSNFTNFYAGTVQANCIDPGRNAPVMNDPSWGPVYIEYSYRMRYEGSTPFKYIDHTASLEDVVKEAKKRGSRLVIELTTAPPRKVADNKEITCWAQGQGTVPYQRLQSAWAIPVPELDFDISISIAKTSGNTVISANNIYYSLAGAEYGLYKEEACTPGTELATITTDESGKGTSKTITLESGTDKLFLKELKAPRGFALDESVHLVTITEEKAAEIPLVDTPNTGSATISKTTTSGAPLAGAQFQMTNWNGEVVKTWTSTTAPTTFTGLPFGTYTITETAAPAGYVKAAQPKSVTLTPENPSGSVSFGNFQMTANKVNASATGLSGATLAVYPKGSGTAVDQWTSDGTPHIIQGLTESQTYTLKEISVPSGYTQANPIDFVPTASGTLNLVMKDTEVTFSKIDAVTRNGVEGATLAIYDSTGREVDRWTTDGAGTPHRAVGLVQGQTYTLKEVVTPYGYVTMEDMEFTVDSTKDVPYIIENQPAHVWIKIRKADGYDHTYGLEGAEFTLYRQDGTIEKDINGEPCVGLTDESGNLTFEIFFDQKNPSWYFMETKAPANYLNDHEGEHFEVTPDETYTFVETDDSLAQEVYDSANSKLYLEKVDADTASVVQGDGTFAGAKFWIFDMKLNEYVLDDVGERVVIETGADGASGEIPQLPTDRDYRAIEFEAPEGYKLPPQGYSFILEYVGEDPETGEQIITGNATEEVMTGKLRLYKHYNAILGDSEFDDQPEEGATFAIVLTSYVEQFGDPEDRNSVLKAVEALEADPDALSEKEYDIKITDAEGMIEFDPLAYGDYTIAQIAKGDPETKIVEETYAFNVGDESWNPTQTEDQEDKYIAVTNDETEYKIRLVKSDIETGKLVTFNSAVFEIRMIKDKNGNEVDIPVTQVVGNQEYSRFKTTSANGSNDVPAGTFYVDTETPSETITPLVLQPGTYEITEVTPPDGFTILDEPLVVELKDSAYTETALDGTPLFTVTAKNTPIVGTLHLQKSVEAFESDKTFINRDDLSNIGFELRAAEDIINMDDGSIAVPKGELAKNIYGETVGSFFVNKDGSKTIEDIYLGKYTLTETVVPDGMIADESREIVFEQEEGNVQQVVYEVSENFLNKTTKLSVSKREVTGDDELPGAHLSVLDSAGSVVHEWVSGEKPYIIEGLKLGETYTLREDLAPLGYAIATSIEFTVNSDGSVTSVVMKDKYIEVEKKDSEENGLSGASMVVYDKNGDVVDSWTTDGTAHRINNLVVGETYTLHEAKAPDGYVMDKDVVFTVEDNEENQFYTIIDQQVIFEKVDVDGNFLEGAEFQVLDTEGNIVDEFETTGKPYAIKNLRVENSYILHESRTPDGYVTINDVQFTVEDDGEDMTIRKIDQQVFVKKQDTEGNLLAGAEFQVLDENGEVVDEWTSTTEPYAIKGLHVDGTYTLKEVKAPEGYVIDADQTFTITDNGENMTLTMVDQQVFIEKYDTEENALPGAEFEVIDKNGDVVDKWTTDDKAHAVKNLRVGETYTLHETKAPEGYVMAADREFTVEDDDRNMTLIVVDEQFFFEKVDTDDNPLLGAVMQVTDATGDVVDEWTTDGETHAINGLRAGESYVLSEAKTPARYVTIADIPFTVEDDNKNETLKAVDQQVIVGKTDTDGDVILGAEFQITDTEGNVIDEWVTDEDPYAVTGLKVGGTYILKETKAPEGYVLAADKEFTVENNNEDLTIIVIDQQVRVIKTDTSETPLEGAVMQVLDTDGNVIDEWTTGDAEHIVNGLRVGGSYILHEETVPEGYVRVKDLEFTIPDNGEDIDIRAVDQQVFVEKQDTEENMVTGAKMQVLDLEGNVIDEWTTDGTAHAVSGLDAGISYILREAEAPEGYVKAADIEFTVESNLKDMTLVMKDKQVMVTKEDGFGEEVPGAELVVYDEEGNVVDEWTSGEEPHPISGLEVGHTYTMHEDVSDIVGYYYAQDFEFEVTDDGVDQEIEVIDYPIQYAVAKVDDYGNYVEGVTLELTDITPDENGEPLNTKIELPNGGVTTGEPFELDRVLTAEHTYELVESEYVEGYYQATSIQFTVPKYGTPEVTTITMEDLTTNIAVEKIDNHGNPVEGAELQIIEAELDEEGNVTEGDIVYEFTSGTEPTDISDFVKGEHNYILRETETPFGYDTAEDVLFYVEKDVDDEGHQIHQLVTMTDNISRINIQINKTNGDGSEKLAGAEFAVYNAKTEEIAMTVEGTEAKGTTDDSGKLEFVLEYSEDGYYVKELKAPEGYELNETEFEVTINEGYDFTKPYVITVPNEEVPKTGLNGSDVIPYAVCAGGGVILLMAVSYMQKKRRA